MNARANTLYTETFGSGPDLVLLHGWGFNSNIWSSIIAPLQQYFCVTLIDLPGFGRSRIVPAAYTRSALVDEILSCVPQKAIYIAWSLGSLIAQLLAFKKPERVSQLIHVCASPRFVVAENWPGVSIELLQQFKQGIDHAPEKTLTRFAGMLALSDEHPKQLSRLLCEKIFEYGLPEKKALLAGLQILSDTDLRVQCGEILCPQNYILGCQDPLVSGLMSAAIKHMMPASHIAQIDNAGHIPFVTHTQQFLKIILPLLQTNEY